MICRELKRGVLTTVVDEENMELFVLIFSPLRFLRDNTLWQEMKNEIDEMKMKRFKSIKYHEVAVRVETCKRFH